MLDFSKLIRQLLSVSGDPIDQSAGRLVPALQAVFDSAKANSSEFAKILSENQTYPFWPLCQPLEPLETVRTISQFKQPYTVVAVDGSQIMPNRHEIHSCYLINLGTTLISYGDDATAILDSEPLLFHGLEDLYPLFDKHRLPADELFISLERHLLELTKLAELAAERRHSAAAATAFIDGSLRQWSLERMPESYQKSYLARLIPILESFEEQRLPLIGYISHSRSCDTVNALRAWQCPYPIRDCRRYCAAIEETQYPCSTIWPANDRQLFTGNLAKFQRSPIFLSGITHHSALAAEHRLCFTYVNVGSEIARIEIPAWLAADRNRLDEALQIVISQVEKGEGYPICLAEAHNMAVIRAGDRGRFFQMLGEHLILLGDKRVAPSPKEIGKRRGIL